MLANIAGLFVILVLVLQIVLSPMTSVLFRLKLIRSLYMIRTSKTYDREFETKYAKTVLKMDRRQYDFICRNHSIAYTWANWLQMVLRECCCVCILNKRLQKLNTEANKRLAKDLDIVWLVKSVKKAKAFLKGKLMTETDRLIAKNALAQCIYVDGSEYET